MNIYLDMINSRYNENYTRISYLVANDYLLIKGNQYGSAKIIDGVIIGYYRG